jgi:hypothetical protein
MPLSKKQKRHAKKTANKALDLKMKVERPFTRELKTYFNEQSKNVRSGNLIDSISPVLDHHYRRIVREMTGIRLKQEEDDYGLEDRILLLLLGRATTQAITIDKTTNKLLNRAVEIARQELANDNILFPTQSTLNRISSQIFKSLNRGRVGGIATTETQMLVEKIRAITSEVARDMMEDAIANTDQALADRAAKLSESLTYEEVADDIGEVPNSELFVAIRTVDKTWVTVGDKRVRATHNAANFQTVPEGEPFVVGNSLLMFPGDTSLGAEISEIANCRCSSVRL